MSIASTPTSTRLEFGSAGMPMTPEEFDAIDQYDDAYCYELIHAVVVVSPIPSEGEAAVNDLLGHVLRQYLKFHQDGASLDDTLPERFIHTGDSRRRADRVIWAGLGRRPDPREDVPAIVFDSVSQSRRDHRRDYVEKRAEYLALGVNEYWVFNRFNRTLTVFQPTDPEEAVYQEADTITTSLLPGFELPLAKLLEAADRWTEE